MARYAFWSSWPEVYQGNVWISIPKNPQNDRVFCFLASSEKRGTAGLDSSTWSSGLILGQQNLHVERRFYEIPNVTWHVFMHFEKSYSLYNIISNILFVVFTRLPSKHKDMYIIRLFRIVSQHSWFRVCVCLRFKSPGNALSSETNFSWITCQRPGNTIGPISSPRFRFLLRIIEAEVKW